MVPPDRRKDGSVKLYYAEVLNPRKVCAFAKHVAAPVEFVRVDLAKGEHLSRSFRVLNPNGKVPVLQDSDTLLWEADAIMCHLAFRTGSDLWPRDARQVDVVRWLCWNQAHFNRCAGQLYFENVIKARYGGGSPDEAKVKDATRSFKTFARVLESHLDDRSYLVAESLSVADFAVGATLPYAAEARLPLEAFPAIRRWQARLDEMPAWRDPYPPTAAAA